MKKIFIAIALILLLAVPSAAGPNMGTAITFEWDANTERDLEGYRLYMGRTSRYDSALKPAEILLNRQNRCNSLAEERIQGCKDSWANWCSDEDKLCDKDFFNYDRSIRIDAHLKDGVVVDHVTSYKLENIEGGKWYFAITAYDNTTNKNESKFSSELSLTINLSEPGTPQNFKLTMGASNVIVETPE